MTPTIPEGFTPWSGGKNPAVNKNVSVIFRDGTGMLFEILDIPSGRFEWEHDGSGNDIIAYRTVTP